MRATTLGSVMVGCALVALVLAAPCRAEEVILNDGTVHEATILGVDKDHVTFQVLTKTSGKLVTLKWSAKRFDPHYLYGVKDRFAGNDAKAHVELAAWAVEQGMFSRAKAQMMKAETLDPAYVKELRDGKLPEIREGLAASILASAKVDIEKGRLDVAEQKLEVLLSRMPDTEAGNEARAVAEALMPLIEEADAKAEAAALAKLAEDEKKAAAVRAKQLAPIDADLAKARKQALAGLAEDSETKALSLLKDAMHKGAALLQDLEALAKDAAADDVLAKEVASRRDRIRAGMVKVHLHRAEIYIVRGDTDDATKELAAARELDPENADVASAAVRAEKAESDIDIHDQRARRARAAAGSGRFSGGARGGGGGGGHRR